MKWTIITLAALVALTGCQTLNPYDKASDCPDPFKGDCVSMQTAYQKSKSDPKNREHRRIDPNHDSPLIKDRPNDHPETNHPLTGDAIISMDMADATYKYELYQEIAGLVKQPITPVRIPAKQMRVLILGYDREDRFYSHRYVFFESDKPRWILDIIKE